MAKLTIEKNVPLPDKTREKIYPFQDMEIGDSFLIKIEDKKLALKKKQNIYIAIWRYCQVHPDKKFTTASFSNDVRVWRIK
jgi:hypothetical protein